MSQCNISIPPVRRLCGNPQAGLSQCTYREQVLFAAEEHPQLLPLILRKFSSDGDVETAQRLVRNSRGIERTRELAASHAQLAMDAVRGLPAALTSCCSEPTTLMHMTRWLHSTLCGARRCLPAAQLPAAVHLLTRALTRHAPAARTACGDGRAIVRPLPRALSEDQLP